MTFRPAQRRILAVLLDHHPRLLSIDERRDLVGDELFECALAQLSHDGVVTPLGDTVGASWVAERTARVCA